MFTPKIQISIFSFIIIVSFVMIFTFNKSNNPTFVAPKVQNGIYKESSFDHLPSKEITMLEAYKMSLAKARTYDSKAEVFYFNSVDDRTVSGQDGKKGKWQGVFALPTTHHNMITVIEAGKLKGYQIADGSDNLTINDSDLKVDSPEIVNSAINQFHLQPGPINDPFSHGYHFKILRDEKHLFIAVDGKIEGRDADIYFNPRTGQYVGRTQKNK